MSKPSELIPIGVDVGSLHARVAIGNLTHNNAPAAGLKDTRPLPEIIANAQGSRYTLALVGTDKANEEENGKKEEIRHIFGDAARRVLAREKKPTISKDPSSMVRELVKSSSSVGKEDEKSAAAVAFFSHLTELACDASSAHPDKLRTVVSVPVASTPEEQADIVQTVEVGIEEALAARLDPKEVKALKKKKGTDKEEPLVMAVITDPAAVCIAHGLTEIEHPGVIDLSEKKSESTTWKNALVIDWGASGLTATHVCRASTNSSLLSIVKHVNDATCSGTDIITALAKHCASMFERKNRVSGLLDNKKACHKLEMACESAVRTLSRAPTVTVAVDGLYEGIDMNVPISRPRFDMLMSGIMRKAEALLKTFSEEAAVKFDVVLLAGNVCDMPAASTLFRTKLFPDANAGRGDVPADEAVAIGCARHAASILACETHFKHGGKTTEGLGPATRKVKVCPLTIGICRIEDGKVNGDVEEVIKNDSVPLIEIGEPLPANVTRKITYKDAAKSSVAIVQMQGGAGKKGKVIGKIENVPEDGKDFEITVELSSDGKLEVSLNGGPSTGL